MAATTPQSDLRYPALIAATDRLACIYRSTCSTIQASHGRGRRNALCERSAHGRRILSETNTDRYFCHWIRLSSDITRAA
ncbi:hypothetical protein Bcep1808_6514 [Burkholderia vietnamiensis G4]|uniref:Uncharacterized protein n=1 Tax=Burkholderia vietnamiensis (strain G4 / LMG 22486) TaxID=269482 RepID=A4JT08_BURVG|nr:hypothetical protein Bcep1808_6514 [Burkholderia vietnamiensis G4]